MTRSDFRPAWASAGANRSGRVMYHKTLPRVRAAMPAANSAAAAPSIAPLPPPATSCKEPSASPPPGRCRSSAGWDVRVGLTPSLQDSQTAALLDGDCVELLAGVL